VLGYRGAQCFVDTPITFWGKRTNCGDLIIVAGFLLIALPIFFICTLLFPVWGIWALGSAKSIFWYDTNPITGGEAPIKYSRDGSCGYSGGIYWCLYWEVLIYYMYLYGLAATCLIARFCEPLERFLHMRLFKMPAAISGGLLDGVVCMGDLLMTLWVTSLYCAWVGFWYGHYWDSGTDQGANCADSNPDLCTDTERWARIFGQLSNLTMSLLVLPVSRNNVWTKVVGISWEAMCKYHVVLGYMLLWMSLIHQLLFWGVYAIQAPSGLAAWPRDILAVPTVYHGDNWAIPLMVIVWLCVFVCMGVLAYHKVRRANFELFYYSHHIFLVLYVAALYHASSLWMTLLAGLALWFVDRLLRFTKGCQIAHVSTLQTHPGGVTELAIDSLDNGTCHFEAGQYAFINIPAISSLQWHPFTIASAPCEGVIRFYIKNMGKDTWTSQLSDLASSAREINTAKEMPMVNVDHSYGYPPMHKQWSHWERVILIVGGIGVTPALSIVKQLHHLSSHDEGDSFKGLCDFIWCAQNYEQSAMTRRVLTDISSSSQSIEENKQFDVRLFLTRQKGEVESPPYPTYFERPNYEELLADERRSCTARKTIVFACGPETMVKMAEDISFKLGYSFHAETFIL